MEEQNNPTPNQENAPETKAPEAKPTETKAEEHMIPKSRFDEINQKFKTVQSQLEAIMAEKAEAEKKSKEEQGKFEELYKSASDELTRYKGEHKAAGERVSQLEAAITHLVETKLEAVPEEFRDLVPANLSPEAKLDWLAAAEAKGLFGQSKKETPIGESTNPAQNQTMDVSKLSPAQLLRAAYGKK